MNACRDLWQVYLICMAYVDACDRSLRKWAVRDADCALDNYLAAVEWELERRPPWPVLTSVK